MGSPAPHASHATVMCDINLLICFQALVIAGIADVNRPAHKLSVRQSGALAATGMIWSRYSLVITPKNWNLFSVNIFVACTGLYQLARIWRSVEW